MKRPAAAPAHKKPAAPKKPVVNWSEWTQEDDPELQEENTDSESVASNDGQGAVSGDEDDGPSRVRGVTVQAGESENGQELRTDDASAYTPKQKYPHHFCVDFRIVCLLNLTPSVV